MLVHDIAFALCKMGWPFLSVYTSTGIQSHKKCNDSLKAFHTLNKLESVRLDLLTKRITYLLLEHHSLGHQC